MSRSLYRLLNPSSSEDEDESSKKASRRDKSATSDRDSGALADAQSSGYENGSSPSKRAEMHSKALNSSSDSSLSVSHKRATSILMSGYAVKSPPPSSPNKTTNAPADTTASKHSPSLSSQDATRGAPYQYGGSGGMGMSVRDFLRHSSHKVVSGANIESSIESSLRTELDEKHSLSSNLASVPPSRKRHRLLEEMFAEPEANLTQTTVAVSQDPQASSSSEPVSSSITCSTNADDTELSYYRRQVKSTRVATPKRIQNHRDAADFDERPFFTSIEPVRDKVPIALLVQDPANATSAVESEAASTVLPPESSCIPGTAARYLRDYQVAGIQWMWKHYCERIGGILGYVFLNLQFTLHS